MYDIKNELIKLKRLYKKLIEQNNKYLDLDCKGY